MYERKLLKSAVLAKYISNTTTNTTDPNTTRGNLYYLVIYSKISWYVWKISLIFEIIAYCLNS